MPRPSHGERTPHETPAGGGSCGNAEDAGLDVLHLSPEALKRATPGPFLAFGAIGLAVGAANRFTAIADALKGVGLLAAPHWTGRGPGAVTTFDDESNLSAFDPAKFTQAQADAVAAAREFVSQLTA